MTASAHRIALLSSIIALVTFSIYWQVTSHGLHLCDDGDYVANNPVVLGGITSAGVKWAFTTFHSSNWHPLTWLSLMLDVQLFGMKPAGHHLVNLILHIVNSVLAMLLLFRLTTRLRPSFLAAMFFAVHPLHVESVAWIAERKDLLSGLFFFATILAWHRYRTASTLPRYLLALGLFTLGLLSKPMLVTLPLLLLLLDWWPFGRLQSPCDLPVLIAEKIPFFVLTMLSSVVTYLAQNAGGAVISFIREPLSLRIANAAVSYMSYLYKTFWPADLAVFYPFPPSPPWWSAIGSGIALIILTLVLYRRRIGQPYLLVGWLWFLGMLVPVIGIVQVGEQAMADRYSYLPHIGLFITVIWGLADWGKTSARQRLLTGSAVAVIILLAAASWRQAAYWQNNITLFAHALEITPATPLAKARLGKAYNDEAMNCKEKRDLNGALDLLRIAANMAVGTFAATVHNNMGLILAMQGHTGEAAREFGVAIEHDPNCADPYLNLGLLSYESGRYKEAQRYFNEVLRLNPDNETALWYHEALKTSSNNRSRP